MRLRATVGTLLSLSRRMSASATRVPLRGVVFDMDGTLTVPNIDFAEMYRRAGVPRDGDILSERWRSDPHAEAVVEEVRLPLLAHTGTQLPVVMAAAPHRSSGRGSGRVSGRGSVCLAHVSRGPAVNLLLRPPCNFEKGARP